MNINKNNYEAFFLDYHEGNLSPQQVADLLLFVEQHPELKEEFESFENVTLDDLSSVSFEGKSSLKKEITLDNREDYFIRNVENTLTSAEKNLLDTFIKQHPQFLTELDLFQKTKMFADTSVIYENKESLKKDLTTATSKGEGVIPDTNKWDDLLIASIEGTLTSQETILLNQQLSVDAEMKNNYSLFKQTKLVADTTIVFENKEELKRKERKVIPLFYYVAAAASIAFLIGLFFMYNNTKNNEPGFADKKLLPIENTTTTNEEVKNNQPIESNVIVPNQVASVVKNNKANTATFIKKDNPPLLIKEQPEINIVKNEVQNKIEESPKNEVIVNNELPKINDEQPIAKVENKQPSTINEQPSPSEFLSLKEVFAQKLKEKILDEESLAVQKQNGRSKRFSGWDFAQIVTRGISKVTGRDVEVKPTYNDNGDVTAYALGGGFQVTRGK